MYLHPMWDFSKIEFPKLLSLDHYSFQFTSMTALYSPKHAVNLSRMTQQSTAVTLISSSYRSHYIRASTVCHNGKGLIIRLYTLIRPNDVCLYQSGKIDKILLWHAHLFPSEIKLSIRSIYNHKIHSVTIDCSLTWSGPTTTLCKGVFVLLFFTSY